MHISSVLLLTIRSWCFCTRLSHSLLSCSEWAPWTRAENFLCVQSLPNTGFLVICLIPLMEAVVASSTTSYHSSLKNSKEREPSLRLYEVLLCRSRNCLKPRTLWPHARNLSDKRIFLILSTITINLLTALIFIEREQCSDTPAGLLRVPWPLRWKTSNTWHPAPSASLCCEWREPLTLKGTEVLKCPRYLFFTPQYILCYKCLNCSTKTCRHHRSSWSQLNVVSWHQIPDS